ATIGTTYGFFADNPSNSGTITANYGVYIVNQTAGTSDYGLYIQGADTYALLVDSGASRFDGQVRVGSGGTIYFANGDGDLYVENDVEIGGYLGVVIADVYGPFGVHGDTTLGNESSDTLAIQGTAV